MRDVGERAAVDEGGRALQALHEVGREGVAQQRRHGAARLQLLRGDGGSLAPRADLDAREPGLQIGQVAGEAEHRHHFARHRDVEAVLARAAVRGAAEAVDDAAQRAVVHVHPPPPGDAARVEAERVAPVEVVVHQRREQVVGARDGVEVAGEVEVDLLHRRDLGTAAAGGAALHAEAGPEAPLAQADHRLAAERRLAQAHHRPRADPAQRVAEADHGRRLALAGRGRVDAGDEDERAH